MIACKYEKQIGDMYYQFGYKFPLCKEWTNSVVVILMTKIGEERSICHQSKPIHINEDELENLLYESLAKAKRDCTKKSITVVKKAIPDIKGKIVEGYFRLRKNPSALKELRKYGL